MQFGDLPGTFGAILDPSTRLQYRDPIKFDTGKWCRVLIECTVKMDFEPEEQYGGTLPALGNAG